MPRIRTIKPEFWQDEKLGPLDPQTRLVFLGLISQADDAGRLLDSIKVIDAFIFAHSDETSREALDILASLGRIHRYVVRSGQALIQIVNWARHQKVDHPCRHVFPPPEPDGALASMSRGDRDTTNDRRPTINDHRPSNGEPGGTTTAAVGSDEPTGKPQGSRSRRSEIDYVAGRIMPSVRKYFYVPDGRVPVGYAEDRDVSIIKSLLGKGLSETELLEGIEGLALMRDAGRLDFCRPGQKLTVRALYNTRQGVVPTLTLAQNYLHKHGGDDERGTGPVSLAAMLEQARSRLAN